jgi:nucleoside phosphorylase
VRYRIGRASVSAALQKLRLTDPPHILVAGAKVIGLLSGQRDDPDLRQKLVQLVGSEDPGVESEARYQSALLTLASAFQARTHDELLAMLREARTGFAGAEALEEMRPDAALFGVLIDLVLRFDALELDRQAAAAGVHALTERLRALAGGLGERVFQGNRSPAAVQLATRSLEVAEALESAAGEVAKAARWSNFDHSVVCLAECYGAIQKRPDALPGMERPIQTICAIADSVLKPRLGPVLMRKVGRESLAQVIANYRHLHGEGETLAGLHALQEAELQAEREPGLRLSEEKHGKLAALAAQVQRTPDELVDDMIVVVQEDRGAAEWAVKVGLLPSSSLAAHKEGRGMSLPTVGIITALAEEFDAVRIMLQNEARHRTPGPGAGHEYILGEVPSPRGGTHRVALAQTARMGNNSAALRASKLLADFPSIDLIIMCGIAGGVPNPGSPQDHVRLGDIVVSDGQGVIQYDIGKQALASFDNRHAPRPPSSKLLEAVQVLEQDRLDGRRPWDDYFRQGLERRGLSRPADSTDVVLDKAGVPVDHPPVDGPVPRIFRGPIASANCVQGDYRRRDRLREKFKIKAVEMEGSGIADATWEYEKAGYLIVRGICDYCDARNKATQTDAWKPYVAMAAAAYTRALLEAIPGGNPAS